MTCVSRLGICSVRVSRILMWFIISLASHSYRPTGYMHAYIHTHRSMPFTRLFSSFFASLSAFSSLYLVLHLKVDLLFLSQCNAQSTRRLISLFLFFSFSFSFSNSTIGAFSTTNPIFFSSSHVTMTQASCNQSLNIIEKEPNYLALLLINSHVILKLSHVVSSHQEPYAASRFILRA